MAKSKTVLLHCTLEDGKTPRQAGERVSIPEALAKSLVQLGLAEILDQSTDEGASTDGAQGEKSNG